MDLQKKMALHAEIYGVLSKITKKIFSFLSILLLVAATTSCSGGDVPAQATGTTSSSTTTTPTSALSMSVMTFGVNPLSSYGTTSISITVLSGGVAYTIPVAVAFTSTCAETGKAALTSSVTTVNGVATASYVDNACGGSDIVLASISDGPSASGNLTVSAPESGALTFVSASPQTLTLRGTGGAGSAEISRVIFKVVDVAGNPIGGKTVNFALSTAVGGISLSNTSAISDATTGYVSVDVQSGTVGTPVRVTATTITSAGLTLATQSSQLSISTGLPDQNSASLSVSTFNIEGLNFDGVTTSLTIRLSDHYNNPVPDGTAIYFTTEGGSIEPGCTTISGGCSVNLTSQNPRPADGRVTVLAYAIGEESFKDLDGDGLADLSPNETVLDMPEAWLDDNFDGIKDGSESFIDFDADGTYDAADGKFNAILCNETVDPRNPSRISSAGSCSSQKTIHVRQVTEIVFSGSDASVGPAAVVLSSCSATDQETLTVTDTNGNPMPSGTTIALSATGNIGISGTSSFTVANSNGSGNGSTIFPFQITGSTGCASGNTGLIQVKVTTAKSVLTLAGITTSAL